MTDLSEKQIQNIEERLNKYNFLMMQLITQVMSTRNYKDIMRVIAELEKTLLRIHNTPSTDETWLDNFFVDLEKA